MSKDVVIAGVIVAACLGLVVVAFTLPKKSDKAATTDTAGLTATTTDAGNATPILPGESGAGTTTFDNSFGNTGTGAPGFGNTGTGAPGFGNTGTSTPGFGNTGTSTPGFGNTGTSTPGFGNTGTSTPGFGNTGASTPGFGNTGFSTPGTGVAPLPPLVTPGVIPGSAVDAGAAAVTGEKSHVVAKGETLGDISMKYYNTSKYWKKIAEANKADPASLQVGTKLVIPEIAPAVSAAGTPTTAGEAAGGEATYKIKAGDTYYSVAKKELGSAARWKELEKLNKIAPEDMRVGMTIKLPKKADTTPAPAPGAEPAPPGPGTEPAGNGRSHVVAAGETLGDISKKHYGTTTKWREIAKANPGLEPETLKIGQKLVIPEIPGLKPVAPAGGGEAPIGAPAPAPVAGSEYVIKPGDTLDEIAHKQLGKKGDAKKIIDANPGLDPRRLRIGQKIVIPGKSDGAAPAIPGVPAPDAGAFPAFPSTPAPTPGGAGLPPAPGGAFAPPTASNPDLGFNPWLPPKLPKPAPTTGNPVP